jgi:FkbM family methyltransferase
MLLERMAERWRHRHLKRDYRAMVRRWYADGGDARFRFDYLLAPSSLVLDLGGYEGQWASDLYARHRCRICVFEPVKRFADAIEMRFIDNPDITTFAFALGGRSRNETISVCGASSSAYKRKADKETVRFVDVKQWFEEHAVDSVQLMKINIEGGEYELLERMIETDLIRRVSNLQVQFHYFAADAQIRMERIQDALRATHKPTYQYPFVWENWERKTVID